MKDLPEKIYLTRIEAAEYVSLHGLPCSPRTLTKMACVGGGPKYMRFGKNSIYTEADLDAWIAKKMRAPEEFVLDRAMRGSRKKSGEEA